MFNLGRILAALALLIIANRRGATAGAVCGLASAAVLALYSPGCGKRWHLRPGGYAVWLFRHIWETHSDRFFLSSFTPSEFSSWEPIPRPLPALFDLLLASALFMAMPQKLLKSPAPVDANQQQNHAGNRAHLNEAFNLRPKRWTICSRRWRRCRKSCARPASTTFLLSTTGQWTRFAAGADSKCSAGKPPIARLWTLFKNSPPF